MPNKTYDTLVTELERIFHIHTVCLLLEWDEQVNLPSGAHNVRASQLAAMAELHHRTAKNPEIGEWLEILEKQQDALTSDQKVVLREAAKSYHRITRLPSEFVQRRARAQSASYHAWVKARENDDFALYAPFLEEQIHLTCEEANYVGEGNAIYDYCIDKHDPEIRAATIQKLFTDLKADLIPLVDAITDSPVKPDLSIMKGFPVDRQKAFLKTVVSDIGFDFQHGRIDKSIHPFCGGIGPDIRMTTRFDENDPIDSLFGAVHEAGHGIYEQGLPRNTLGTALSEAVGMAVHESQSRLWENQVGRSRAFWNYYEPKYRKVFPKQLEAVSSKAFFLAINNVQRSLIRFESDEVTYNLHIILRFEIEKQLFDKTLAVKDLPEAWNALSQEIIGLTPKNDREGVLQDIHWCDGSFGYFPSYCLGNMLAAQIWYTVLDTIPDLESKIEQGNFNPLIDWLREQIHQHGKRYNTLDLTQRVTGQPLSHHALIRYLKERYLPIYS
jgi:carboxypeptidase Taq